MGYCRALLGTGVHYGVIEDTEEYCGIMLWGTAGYCWVLLGTTG